MPIEYVRDFYGIEWPLRDELREDFESWQGQLRRPAQCARGTLSRYELEGFMQRARVVSKKWMGARLGMSTESFDLFLTRMQAVGLRPQRYVIYPEMISEDLSEDLVSALPGLRFRTFYDHNSFCERLHSELKRALEIDVHPLFCATSDRIQEYPRQYATHFDCVTLAPLSAKHQLWLDFRKPLTLGPDRCSKLFYVENRDVLQPFCAGTREPDDLELYEQFLTGQQHAG